MMHDLPPRRRAARLSILLLAVLVLPAAIAGDPQPAAEARPLSAEALLERARGENPPLVLDVRTAEEFAAGHVPGAVNIPHDELPRRLAELDGARERDVVLYCRSGRRARIAAATLVEAGFGKLWHLEGDMLGWLEEGRPVER